MLKSAYPFYYIMREKGDGNGLVNVYLYRFKSKKSNLAYIVRVEQYKNDVYAIKFYQKSHQDSPNIAC